MGNASSLFDGSYEVGEAFPELSSTSSDGERKQGWSLQLAEDSSGRRVSIFLYPTDTNNVEYVDNAVKVYCLSSMACSMVSVVINRHYSILLNKFPLID